MKPMAVDTTAQLDRDVFRRIQIDKRRPPADRTEFTIGRAATSPSSGCRKSGRAPSFGDRLSPTASSIGCNTEMFGFHRASPLESAIAFSVYNDGRTRTAQ